MAADELRYPYAYDEELKDYVAPDDPRVRPGRIYKVGLLPVTLVRSNSRRWHFRSPAGSGGGSGPETIAHIFAKKYYKEAMRFTAVIARQRVLFRFASCILEQRLDERTPDLTATIAECWPPFWEPGSTFLIEIHAKNAIYQNLGRREALTRIGAPCIEVHLPPKAIAWRFGDNDPHIEVAQFESYMRIVLRDPWRAEWIVPALPPVYHSVSDAIVLSGTPTP